MSHTILLILFTLLLLPGLIGILVPAIPGIPYMFVIALVAAFIEKFKFLTGRELLWLAGLAVASLIIDYAAGMLGARFGGASKKALLWGFIGAIVGALIIPPFGSFPGLFVGIIAAEMSQGRERKLAVKAATGGVIGSLAGTLLNLLLALLFIALFVVFSFQ